MKALTKYYNVLAENDVYITPKEKAKKSIFPVEFRFYTKLIYLFVKANILTKQKIYNRFSWVRSSQMIMDELEHIGIRFEISGMKNLTLFEGPAIFICNHMSSLETVALPRILNPKKLVVFVTKQELNDLPLFGPINSARFPIVVGRENAREDLLQVMNQGAERISNGRSIILFPQKTRSPIFDVKNFNTLGVKLAKKNNVPVVPIALVTDAWGNGKLVKDFGKIDINKNVYFSIGKPIYISGNGSEQHTEVIDFITSHLKKWGREELIKV